MATNPVPTAPPTSQDAPTSRSHSAQLALAFLLGVVISLLGGKFWHNRLTRPLDEANAPYAYRIDLNRAGVNELAQLPRVGPAMAERIVDARPFQSIEDLKRVGGYGPAAQEKLSPHVIVGPETGWNTTTSRKIDLPIDPNTASLDELQTLPGIGPKLAQRIIDERAKRPFEKLEDLRRVPGIGPKTLEKLRQRIVIVPNSAMPPP